MMPELCDYQTYVYTTGTTAILDAGDTSTWTMHDIKLLMSPGSFQTYFLPVNGYRHQKHQHDGEKGKLDSTCCRKTLVSPLWKKKWQHLREADCILYDTGRVFEQTSSGFSFSCKPSHFYMQSNERECMCIWRREKSQGGVLRSTGVSVLWTRSCRFCNTTCG